MLRLLILTLFALAGPLSGWTAPTTLRVGYFPNITHTQALIASELTRQEKGWFESRLGPEVKIVWYAYNAGPSAMEALAGHSIPVPKAKKSESSPVPPLVAPPSSSKAMAA